MEQQSSSVASLVGGPESVRAGWEPPESVGGHLSFYSSGWTTVCGIIHMLLVRSYRSTTTSKRPRHSSAVIGFGVKLKEHNAAQWPPSSDFHVSHAVFLPRPPESMTLYHTQWRHGRNVKPGTCFDQVPWLSHALLRIRSSSRWQRQPTGQGACPAFVDEPGRRLLHSGLSSSLWYVCYLATPFSASRLHRFLSPPHHPPTRAAGLRVVLFADLVRTSVDEAWILSSLGLVQRYTRRNFSISLLQLVQLILAVLMAFVSGLLNASACPFAWDQRGVIFRWRIPTLVHDQPIHNHRWVIIWFR